jgi:hypothetical protein
MSTQLHHIGGRPTTDLTAPTSELVSFQITVAVKRQPHDNLNEQPYGHISSARINVCKQT